MTAEQEHQLTPSELQTFRDSLKERDHRRWLISWIKTLATWTGAGVSAMWAGIEGVTKLLDLWAKK